MTRNHKGVRPIPSWLMPTRSQGEPSTRNVSVRAAQGVPAPLRMNPLSSGNQLCLAEDDAPLRGISVSLDPWGKRGVLNFRP
jgi:hypothetical protein